MPLVTIQARNKFAQKVEFSVEVDKANKDTMEKKWKNFFNNHRVYVEFPDDPLQRDLLSSAKIFVDGKEIKNETNIGKLEKHLNNSLEEFVLLDLDGTCLLRDDNGNPELGKLDDYFWNTELVDEVSQRPANETQYFFTDMNFAEQEVKARIQVLTEANKSGFNVTEIVTPQDLFWNAPKEQLAKIDKIIYINNIKTTDFDKLISKIKEEPELTGTPIVHSLEEYQKMIGGHSYSAEKLYACAVAPGHAFREVSAPSAIFNRDHADKSNFIRTIVALMGTDYEGKTKSAKHHKIFMLDLIHHYNGSMKKVAYYEDNESALKSIREHVSTKEISYEEHPVTEAQERNIRAEHRALKHKDYIGRKYQSDIVRELISLDNYLIDLSKKFPDSMPIAKQGILQMQKIIQECRIEINNTTRVKEAKKQLGLGLEKVTRNLEVLETDPNMGAAIKKHSNPFKQLINNLIEKFGLRFEKYKTPAEEKQDLIKSQIQNLKKTHFEEDKGTDMSPRK